MPKYDLPRFLPTMVIVIVLAAIAFNRISLAAPGDSPNLGIASGYAISDPQALNGDIICFSETEAGKLVRCTTPFDPRMFGVLAENPQVVLRSGDSEKPIIQSGKAVVNVTTLGGDIKAGDYVTSSPIPGKGQKIGDYIGYVLGVALESFGGQDGAALDYQGKSYRSGQIEVTLGIGPLGALPRGTVFDKLGFALLRNVQNPQGTGLFLRYVTAGLVVILVTFFAFSTFGRNITKGMESIGRNPLAYNQVQFVIILNTILIAGVVLGGIVISLVIIRL